MDDETDWCWFDDGDSIGIYELLEDGTCGPQIAKVLTENLDEERREQAVEEAMLLSTAPALKRFYDVYVEQFGGRQLPHAAHTLLTELQAVCSPVAGRRPAAGRRTGVPDPELDPIEEAKAKRLRD